MVTPATCQAWPRPMAESMIARGLWLQDLRADRHAALTYSERYALVHGGNAYTSCCLASSYDAALHGSMVELVIARGLWRQEPRASRHAALAIP